jgi:hypothetical protein
VSGEGSVPTERFDVNTVLAWAEAETMAVSARTIRAETLPRATVDTKFTFIFLLSSLGTVIGFQVNKVAAALLYQSPNNAMLERPSCSTVTSKLVANHTLALANAKKARFRAFSFHLSFAISPHVSYYVKTFA